MKYAAITSAIFLLLSSHPASSKDALDQLGDHGTQVASSSICSPGVVTLPQGGGVLVRRCVGGHVVTGVGDNIDAATKNAAGFAAVAEQGVVCAVAANDPFVGRPAPGVGVKAKCGNNSISAFGMTTTSSGINLLELAINLAASGSSCNADYYYGSVHGFKYPYTCFGPNGAGTASGIGSNVDDANAMAVRSMKKASEVGGNCIFEDATLTGVVYKATLFCARKMFIGYGSSVTSAAEDAAAQAGM